MSRGLGKQQLFILEAVQRERVLLSVLDLLERHLRRKPTHSEYTSALRAAWSLAERGLCQCMRAWATNTVKRRSVVVAVAPPGLDVRRWIANTRYDERKRT